MPDNLAGGSLRRRDTAEAGEGGLALQPLGIVSDYGQQRRGVDGAYAWQGNQLRSGFHHQPIELHVQLGDLFAEDLVATGHRTKREPSRLQYVVGVVFEAEAGGHGDELLRRESTQTVAQPVGRRHPQAPEVVGGLRSSGLHRGAAGGPLKARIISTRLSALFLGSPAVSPASTARAALSASRESDLLLRWRWRSPSAARLPSPGSPRSSGDGRA